MQNPDTFVTAFRGSFSGILRWPQLDELWNVVLSSKSDNWYIYAVGEIPPQTAVTNTELTLFIEKIDILLHKEHKQDYCGVVYVDDRQHPEFIKIFDPGNLGVSCGFSDNPPLPGWILSKITPTDLPAALPPPGNRRRWWQRLFST